MRQMTGKQSISFAKAVYIEGSAAIVGEKEKEWTAGRILFAHAFGPDVRAGELGGGRE